ncbi:uncharacterized mitochondrial protein-like protein, partial [Tanacetum coccineum]
RKSALSFMRPFGCPVTIHNTIDHLGKFDRKADDGFFVGYSTNSKVFRVFNSRTRIVEENLHVQFSKNTSNIARSIPNWLFNIDALTNFMNYKPAVAENQSNSIASTKACDDAGKARMETILGKYYILLPMWPADLLFSQNLKDSPDIGFKPSGEEERRMLKIQGMKVEIQLKRKIVSTNNVNDVSSTVNAAGIEVNVVDPKTSIELLNDPNMPKLEDIVYSDDDEDVGIETDMNNLDAFMPIDVKSAFLYGKIEEEVYVCQPPRFEDLDIPDRVYKVEKRDQGDILVVQVYVDDIIFGSTKKKLCTEFEKMMHKKFQMSSMGELTFFLGLQVQQKEDGIFIRQDKYVTEILKKFGFSDVKTANTPMETHKPLLKDADGEDVDEHIFQVNPKVSHLHVVKRIFRYLKGQPKLGLWYLKDLLFDLVAYTDSDYARASLDRKYTTGGIGVNAGNSKLMLLGINLLLLEKVNAARHNLLLLVQFWATAKVKTINGEVQLQALVDGKKVIITKTSRKDIEIPQSSGPIEPIADDVANEENVPTQSNDPPISRVNTLGSREDRLKLKELMDLCTKLSDRVLDLETTKTAQAKEIACLKKRVKKLERKRKSKTPGMKRLFKIGRSSQVVSSEDEEVTLVDETQGMYDDAQMFDTYVFNSEEVFVAEQSEKVVEDIVSTAKVSAAATITTEEITLAQALAALKSAKPKVDKAVSQKLEQCTTKPTATPTTATENEIREEESSSKRAGDELEQEPTKKQKVDDDKEKEDLQQCFELVTKEDVAIDAIPLATKPAPIVNFQIHRKGREDLENLWKLVKAKHKSTRPEEGYERVLWGDLKTMFEHHIEEEVWRSLQRKKVLLWRLYDSCGIHFVTFEDMHVYMLVGKRYPLTPATITNMLNKKLKSNYWNEMCY